MMYLEVVAGLVVLLFGGEALVRGAIGLAERLRLSKLVIGLTVVALGTSAPELVVCIEAALEGVPDIAIGNVVGSNIANVLLVLGLPALIYPINCSFDGPVRRNSAMMVLATLLLVAVGWTRELTAWEGAIFVLLLVAFIVYSYHQARLHGDRSPVALTEELETGTPTSFWLAAIFVGGGLVALAVGSNLLIDGAVEVAEAAGLSQTVIGLTLVAVGTSLPELATTIVAAWHRHGDVAVGNIVGSNMFNILGVMGVTALVAPVPVPQQILHFDAWVMLAVAVVMLLLVMYGRPIGRLVGCVFSVVYGAYVAAQFYGLSGVHPQVAGL